MRVDYKQPSIRHTHTPGNLSSSNASPVAQSFSNSLYSPRDFVLSFVQYNLVNAILGVLFLSFTVSNPPLQVLQLFLSYCERCQ
ncbi:unnamed protein product [Hymenolepis diminuta]|uniref:PRA1 family protein n=1 Tax=Hymenolepis diminuta TaxID=6216 RepID=A0A564Y5P5_HYMDI|nr:unnamed protein product [Hymenolepis diminuta]